MSRYVLRLQDMDKTQIAIVGGKGAQLGELVRLEEVRVPDGFCVTTPAFDRIMLLAGVEARLEQISQLKPDDLESIRIASGILRAAIESVVIPSDIVESIVTELNKLGADAAYAVRSSATVEDLPTASFAGQQDTYLNVVGVAEILRDVSRCWASLFTERAVTYRLRNDFAHQKVRMAVVVQQMVIPSASGILFTADPISGNRKVSSIDASFGLGEALVSGRVNPDVYKVSGDAIIAKTIGDKKLVIEPKSGGGTTERTIDVDTQNDTALTDAQAIELVQLGRKIETHYGCPQDVEWCLANGEFWIVQSRAITTLFPVPENSDNTNRLYISVGHQQMMTDPMKPLGLSVWQLTTQHPMEEAGGRLFVDITPSLSSPVTRAGMLELMGKSDPLIRDAIQTVLDRGDFIRLAATIDAAGAPPPGTPKPLLPQPPRIETDAAVVTELIASNVASVDALKRDIKGKTGAALVDFIVEHIKELQRVLFDRRSYQAIMAGFESTWWLNEKLFEWLGEKGAADTLAQSVPNNITSEMGLALLDVADVIRPFPQVVSFLEHTSNDDFLAKLATLPGGRESAAAIQGWLAKYGMRGVGEIDITRMRWSEQPSMLIQLILGNIKNAEPGEAAMRFDAGKRQAIRKEQEILERLRALPDGEAKASDTKAVIDRLRTFVGYREYPKYGKISGYFVYKQALMDEAARLVKAGVIREAEDIFYLRIQELQEVERTGHADYDLIQQRKDAYRSYHALRPPRVLTSDGEGLNGSYRRDDVPKGALVGLAVSAGTIEGRARVILDMTKADLAPGDILVTAYTDPSWTPLFLAIKGLVTEVGGLMTHGAVIAREYGLPAVVGVDRATQRIRDGQRIRVHGTEGFVELLG